MNMQPSTEIVDAEKLSYSVDNLMNRLNIYGQNKLWNKLEAVVRVQGIALGVKSTSYNGFSYFKLKGTKATLSIKCPSDCLPNEQEHIVIEGMATLKVNRFQSGLDVELEGKPVAQLAPIEFTAPIVEIHKKNFIKLTQSLEAIDLSNFMLLGSDIGIQDVLSQMAQKYSDKIPRKVIVVSNKDKILNELQNLPQNISSFAIVRGGDDETLKIWDDSEFVKKIVDLAVPFYVALGHSHRMEFIERYADESFTTPTAFGTAINEVIERQSHLKKVNTRVEILAKENKVQVSEITKNKEDHIALLNKQYQDEILKLKKESDSKFEKTAKDGQDALANTSKNNQLEIAKLTNYYQDKIAKLNTEKNEKIESLSNANKSEIQAVLEKKNQDMMTLLAENKDLANKLEIQQPRKPIREWLIILGLILLVILLLI